MIWRQLIPVILLIGVLSTVVQAFWDVNDKTESEDSLSLLHKEFTDLSHTLFSDKTVPLFCPSSSTKSVGKRTPEDKFKCIGAVGNLTLKVIILALKIIVYSISETIKIIFDHNSLRNVEENNFGVSRIFYEGQDIKCSAIHLKPWIVLTLADCIEGLMVNNLFVKVHLRNNSDNYVNVRTKAFELSPKYKSGQKPHNFALMTLFAKPDWDVDEFQLPTEKVTTEFILDKKLLTYVERSQFMKDNGFFKLFPATVTSDFNTCNFHGNSTNWFCLVEGSEPVVYKIADRGVPFFGSDFIVKQLFGTYTGFMINKKGEGHLFQSVLPSIPWIEEFMKKNPVPPTEP